MITWRPIAELPDELKDGRQVLLWDGETAWAEIGKWSNVRMASDEPGWVGFDGLATGLDGFSHFAEINAPGQEVMFIRDPLRPTVPPRATYFDGETLRDAETKQPVRRG